MTGAAAALVAAAGAGLAAAGAAVRRAARYGSSDEGTGAP
jgi:hypothetical protein